MTKLNILQYPNTRLNIKAERVTEFDAELQKIIDNMFETHYGTENCAALAATQLDMQHPKHITVIDFSAEKNQPLCLVNAEIIHAEGTMIEGEACMSIAGVYEKVQRASKIKVRAQDRFGKPLELEAEGFMAKCIQHELDHLNGVIFIDRLSRLKRERVDKKFAKHKRWENN